MENELSYAASGDWEKKLEQTQKEINALKSSVPLANAWGWYTEGGKIVFYITDECTDDGLKKSILTKIKAAFG